MPLLQRRRPWPVLAAVLAVHALLLMLLAPSRHGPRQPPAAPGARMTVVWLEALRPSRTAVAPAERPPPPADRTPAPRPVTPRPPSEAMPPVFTAPASLPTPTTTAAPPGPGANTAPAPGAVPGGTTGAEPVAPPPPLRLDLPPARRSTAAPSPAQQAVERQAGGAAPLSAEARMARRLETTWTEENLGDGRIRLRRGEDCVVLKETTASQLDPWNNRGPAPRGASPCP